MKARSRSYDSHQAHLDWMASRAEKHRIFMTRHRHVVRRSIAESSDPVQRNYPRFGFSQKLPPTKCPDCQSTLRPTALERYSDDEAFHGGTAFRKRCCNCGCYIEWSFPNVWKRRHELPLMDQRHMRVIVQEAP